MKLNKLIWIFGQTSDFSKEIIRQQQIRYNDDVEIFGRDNFIFVDTRGCVEKVSRMKVPDYIIINQKCDFIPKNQPPHWNQGIKHVNRDQDPYSWKWSYPLTVINTISHVLDEVQKQNRGRGGKKDINVIFITSSITVTNKTAAYKFKYKDYISIRQMQQQQWMSCSKENMKIACMSPSYLDETNIEEYASRVVNGVHATIMDKHLLDLSSASEFADNQIPWIKLS